MTEPEKKKKKTTARRRWWKFAAVAGAVLGAACNALPPDLQTPCKTVSQVIAICVGGS